MASTTTPADDAGDRSGDTVGGQWVLGRLLGSGGMATVYEATDAEGQRAAVKLLHPEMARRRELKERFLREAYVANRIGHPGIVKVLGHADGPDVFLVIELLEGEPLSARLQRASDFTVRDLLEFADQILDALAAAHKSGVIHRDIKPDNVFVTSGGQIKVLDFGIARVLDDVPSEFKTRTGLALGTIPYMAPEQALGRRGKVDGRTDLFALGALMFRALAGRRIHEEPSEAELLVAMATKPAPRLGEVAPNVPGAVCTIIDKALSFSQDSRYPDAATMQADVRAVLTGQVPAFAIDAERRADEPTRIGAAATSPVANGLAALRDAPTAMTQAPEGRRAGAAVSDAPYSVREHTLESAGIGIVHGADGHEAAPPSLSTAGGFAATPAAFTSDAMPVSLPHSMPHSPSLGVPTLAQPRKRRGLAAILAFSVIGVVALGALGVLAAVLRPWESFGDAAAGASAESPSIAISTAGPTAPSLPGGPAGSGAAGGEDAALAAGPKPTEPPGGAPAEGPAAEPGKPSAARGTNGAPKAQASAATPTTPATAPPAATGALTASGKPSSAAPSTTTPPPKTSAPAQPPATTTPPPATSPTPAPTTPPAKGGSTTQGNKDKDKDKNQKKPK